MSASRRHIAIKLALFMNGDDLPVPRWIQFVDGADDPLLFLDLDSHHQVREWAEVLGLDGESYSQHRAEMRLQMVGTWLGWRVLLTADEPTAEVLLAEVAA